MLAGRGEAEDLLHRVLVTEEAARPQLGLQLRALVPPQLSLRPREQRPATAVVYILLSSRKYEMEVVSQLYVGFPAFSSLTLTAAAVAGVRAGSSPRPPVWVSPPAPCKYIVCSYL